MAEFIRIEVEQTERDLAKMEAAFSAVSMEEFLKGPVTEELHHRADARFASSGDDASGKWAPLSESFTVRDRLESGFPPGPPMVRSGDLHSFLSGTPGQVVNEGDDARLLFPGDGGTQEAKFATAQRGMRPNPLAGHAPIPARPVAAVGAKDVAEISTALHTWLEERMRVGA